MFIRPRFLAHRSTPLVVLLALGMSFVTLVAPASADRVVLENGNHLEGVARRLDNGDVEIASAAGSITVPGSMVVRIEREKTLDELVAQYLDQNPDASADELWEMAREARAQGSWTLERRLLERVLEVDPDHRAARQALGYREIDGAWLTESEWRQARGEVFHQGRWWPQAEYEAAMQADADRRRDQERFRDAQMLARQIELERLRSEQLELAADRQQTEGIPYPWVWAPSGTIVYPPGYPVPSPPPPTGVRPSPDSVTVPGSAGVVRSVSGAPAPERVQREAREARERARRSSSDRPPRR